MRSGCEDLLLVILDICELLRVNYEYLFDWGNNENKRRELGIKSKAD